MNLLPELTFQQSYFTSAAEFVLLRGRIRPATQDNPLPLHEGITELQAWIGPTNSLYQLSSWMTTYDVEARSDSAFVCHVPPLVFASRYIILFHRDWLLHSHLSAFKPSESEHLKTTVIYYARTEFKLFAEFELIWLWHCFQTVWILHLKLVIYYARTKFKLSDESELIWRRHCFQTVWIWTS